MSGAACAAVIVSSQAQASAESTGDLVAAGVYNGDQQQAVVDAGNAYVAALNAVAASADASSDDDDD